MTRTRLLLLGLVMLLGSPSSLYAEPRELGWDDLVPDSATALNSDAAQSAVPSTGTVAALNGVEVKLPGFVVPLDMSGETVSSFLLVPYFGACIHQPPPPPNQTIFVTLKEAIAMETMYYPVWVTGTLATERNSSDLAEAGYTMAGFAVERFEY